MLERQVIEIEAFYRKVKQAGVLPVSAGGDHSITYPIFKAIAADAPIGMVHIDAHTDTWAEFGGSKFTHGAPFRLAVGGGLLDPKRTIQIGIRGGQNTLDGIEFSKHHGMRVIFIEEFAARGVEGVIEEARQVVGDGPSCARRGRLLAHRPPLRSVPPPALPAAASNPARRILRNAAADQCARGFLLGATAGRTTLGGEGLQHQDGSSHVRFAAIPNCRAYDPAFAYESAVMLRAQRYAQRPAPLEN